MPSNIEIKFRVDDLAAIETKVAALANQGPELLIQTDTFFDAPSGRLKLRQFEDGNAELIAYVRSDSESARESQWSRYPTQSAPELLETLTLAIPQTVTVGKQRTLYLIEQTRVHLDQVDDLGSFVELEVVLQDNQSTEKAVEIADQLIAALGLELAERIPQAYADLLNHP